MQENDDGQRIYDAAVVCSDLFCAYLETPQLSSSRHDVATELLGRFNLWGAYGGVFAGPKASLDARLDGHDDVRDMYLELLAMVERNINQELHFGEVRSAVDETPSTASGSPSDDVPVLGLDAVRSALDRLHSLTVAVRRSSARKNSQLMVADASSSQANEVLCYINAVRRRFKFARNSLVEQVGRSIYTRGRALYYQQRHNKKIREHRHRSAPQHVPGELALTSLGQDVTLSNETQLLDYPVPMSETNASRLERQPFHAMLKQHKPSLSQISRGSSVRETDIESFEYPQKPRATGNDSEALCPLCSEPLNVARLTDKAWQAHVDRDMEPYVCISEECSSRFRFFASSKDWKDHMHSTHGIDWAWTVHTAVWQCDVEHTQMTNEPHPTEFNDKEEFFQHMVKAHGTQLTRPQILVRARRNKTARLREPFTCPFCDCLPDEPDFDAEMKPYDLLARHIGRHLKTFAFVSLSYLDLEYDYGSGTSVSEESEDDGYKRKTTGSTSDSDSAPDIFDDIPATIVSETEVRVDDLCFSIPEILDIPMSWPWQAKKFTGPDRTLERFKAAFMAVETKSLTDSRCARPSPPTFEFVVGTEPRVDREASPEVQLGASFSNRNSPEYRQVYDITSEDQPAGNVNFPTSEFYPFSNGLGDVDVWAIHDTEHGAYNVSYTCEFCLREFEFEGRLTSRQS